jgi:hypothetical protein
MDLWCDKAKCGSGDVTPIILNIVSNYDECSASLSGRFIPEREKKQTPRLTLNWKLKEPHSQSGSLEDKPFASIENRISILLLSISQLFLQRTRLTALRHYAVGAHDEEQVEFCYIFVQ